MIRVHDSITKLDGSDEGAVVIAASHGGRYCGYCAAKGRVRAVIFSDAAIGLDKAGIGALEYLDALDIPSAMVDYRTARIGDGGDLTARGTISFCNDAASRLDCKPGQSTLECAEKMLAANTQLRTPPVYEEARTLLLERPRMPKVWGLDSNSLVTSSD
ncbi:MAG: hypothetical protein ACREMT_11735, partial [Vulcanimicrobiaceae bacterium]